MFFWSFSNKKSRSSKWYITAIVGVLVFLVYGIISGVYMMSIASLLFAGVFLLIENNNVPMTEVNIDSNWIFLNEENYNWDNFVSFSIFNVGNLKMIRFVSKNKIANILEFPIPPDIDTIELSDFISRIIPETKIQANTIDNLTRIMQI